MNSTKKLVVILGPTACGKTSLSLEIAKKLNTEIISCDSRQFYKELKIGSAPPTIDEQKLVKHHFIQHISINQDYSIGQYENDAIKKISQLFDKYDYLDEPPDYDIKTLTFSKMYETNSLCENFQLENTFITVFIREGKIIAIELSGYGIFASLFRLLNSMT